jgi:anti-anti-sigma regulatory factor
METMSGEVARRLLDRMPGLAFSWLVHPHGEKVEWIHVDPRKTADLFHVPEDALLRDPMAIMARADAEDRARFEQLYHQAASAATSWSWTGRIAAAGGTTRWIEVQTIVETDAAGAQRWYALAVDATERRRVQRQLEEELQERTMQLARSEEVRRALDERLRAAVDETSNPILEVWDGVLAMPIVGVVDSRRTADMVLRLLVEVARTQARFVIVDLTGVEVVDTKTADHLMKLMRKVEVIGAQCVLTGIQPAVAETLVDIGVDFGRLTTLRNLKHGLREALQLARRERAERVDEDLDPEEPGGAGVSPALARQPQGTGMLKETA